MLSMTMATRTTSSTTAEQTPISHNAAGTESGSGT
jgi:hypothetical protein